MLIIKKFGGTSVGNVERIENVAKIIANSINSDDKIVVVVSAMANVTNKIYEELCSISKNSRNLKEFDQAMATGEQISASLLTIALTELGFQAKSYNAQSLGIYAEGQYGDGYITHIEVEKLKKDLENKIIPVITGFQGFKKNDNSFITLGRGGSDYSAVMIAAAMHADACYIYTDVNGVYTADPRIVQNAIKINELDYDRMIEMANDGAKVLQAKSVIAGKKYNIGIKVLSSFHDDEGTTIINNSFLKQTSNLKIINNNSNLSLISENKIENVEYEFSYSNESGRNFYLVNNNLLYNFKSEVQKISRITIMSLDNSEILDIKALANLLSQFKIQAIYLNKEKNKIILIVNLDDANIVISELHKFYNNI